MVTKEFLERYNKSVEEGYDDYSLIDFSGTRPDKNDYEDFQEYINGIHMAVKRKRKPSNMKGITIGRGMKRPTKAGAGMTKKGVAKYRRQNPGSKLKTAVTEKKPRTKARAARRKSYCARSAGQMKKFPKAARNPNSRLRQARRRWRC